MKQRLEVKLLPDALAFLKSVDEKAANKIFSNMRLLQTASNTRLLKKLNENIWELRTEYSGNQYRLFAFWDKRDSVYTLIIATHGIVKKTSKVPAKEIKKAEGIRNSYFEQTEKHRHTKR